MSKNVENIEKDKKNNVNENPNVPVNNHFFDESITTNDNKKKEYNNENKSQSKLKKIYTTLNGKYRLLTEGDFEKENFSNIKIFHFRNSFKKKYDENGLVYEVKEKPGDNSYYVKTGNYIGKLFFKDGKSIFTLEINSGYNKSFEEHMINYASNVFFKDEFKGGYSKKNNKIMFLYRLFLLRLKKVLALGNPLIIHKVERKSVNVKGRINLKKYLKNEFYYNYKISTILNNIVPEQEIVDIIYKTLYVVHKELGSNIGSDFSRYEKELKSIFSYKTITSITFKKAYNSKLLKNPMYSGYLGVIQISELILKNKGIADENNRIGISGYLMDVTELWEVYLQKVFERGLKDDNFVVKAQNRIEIYKDRFYERENFPDIIIENEDGEVAVIDAKFKNMEYYKGDVDRPDLHQIHSYAFNYYSKIKNKLKLCSLLYPVREDCKTDKNKETKIFGDSDNNHVDIMFKILTLEIPSSDKAMQENEDNLSNEIKRLFKL